MDKVPYLKTTQGYYNLVYYGLHDREDILLSKYKNKYKAYTNISWF